MPKSMLIKDASIISQDDSIGNVTGDILIRDGIITAVGVVDADEAVGAEVINARNMIATPGFVDTHRHTWQSCLRHRNGDHSGTAYFREMLDTIGPEFTAEESTSAHCLGLSQRSTVASLRCSTGRTYRTRQRTRTPASAH